MAFNAGAVIAKMILDTTNWVSGANTVKQSASMMGNAFSLMQGLVTQAATAIFNAAKKSIEKANEWQIAFGNVTTVLDTTKYNAGAMAKEVLLLNPALGSSIDLANGLYEALSASVDPEKSIGFIAEAAKFAKASLVDTKTSVNAITTALNAYGQSADMAGGVSDKFFKVIELGKITGEELANNLGKSIPLAANMNIGLDELGATMAVMTQQGVNAARATTQFNSIVSAFIKPSDDMTKTITKLGFESGEAMIKQLGFKNSVDAIVKSTGGSNEELAKNFRNVNALKGIMAITGEGAKNFNSTLEAIKNSSGATNTAFEKQEKTFDTFKNQMDKLYIVGGNVGKVFVDQIAVGATQAAEALLKFLLSGQGAEFVSEIIARAAAGFEVLKKMVEPLLKLLKDQGEKIWNTLVTSLDSIFGKTKEGTGGFDLFAGAAQIAASIIKVFGKIIDGVIENITNFVNAIKESAGIIGTFFEALTGKKKWSEVDAQVKKAGDAFNKFFVDSSENMNDVWNTVFDEAKTFADRTKKMSSEIEVSYKTTFNNVKNNTKENYTNMVSGMNDAAAQLNASLQSVSLTSDETTDNQIKNEIAKQDYMLKTADIILQAQNKAVRDAAEYQEKVDQEKQEKLKQNAESTASFIISTFQPIAVALGNVLLQQENSWENLKKAALGALASIIEAFAEKWTLLAVEAALELNIPASIGWGLLAAAGFTGASVVRGLEGGGIGSGLTLVGEGGPELVDFRSPARVYNNIETNNMLSPNINYNPTFIVKDQKDIEIINNRLGATIQKSIKRI